MKKRRFVLVVSLLISMFILNGVLAVEGVDLKITGSIGDYGDDVYLITDTNADEGVDSYDLPERTPPSDYASFYSDIDTGSLEIDFWD